MSNVVRNFRHAIENGKARILLHSSPQFIQGREDWVDLEQEYADVKDIRMPQDVPTSLQTKYKEWRDIERHFHIPRLAEEIILDTDDISSINIHGRTEGIKQAESILVDKGKTHWVPTGQTELVEDPITGEMIEREIYKKESLLEPLIQYPRELVWLDGAEDIPGTIILPHDDYDKVYVLEGTKENPTIRFIDDKETAQGVRPYYEKPGDGKTYIYVNGFSGGAGTQSDPYIITTAEELQAINNNLSAHYALGCDIDCSDTINWNTVDGFSYGFQPIGQYNYPDCFQGSLDGRGYRVKNLYINRGNEYNVALFSGAHLSSGSKIVNITLENPQVNGNQFVAPLIGNLEYAGDDDNSLSNIQVLGGRIQGNHYLGGVIAVNNQGYDRCFSDILSTASVGGHPFATVGGIFADGEPFVGIKNALFAGEIWGNTVYPICPADNSGDPITATNCYWDSDVTGISTAEAGTPLTTAQAKQQESFVGWDFTNVWGIDPAINGGYPYLRGFSYEEEEPEPEPLAPGYHVECRVDGGTWEPLVHLPLTKFSHIDDTAITVGSQYEYRIKKVFEWGDETDWSNISSLQLLAWLWRGRKTEFPSEQTINVLDVVRTFPTDFSIKYWGDVIERQTNGGSWEIIEVLQNLSGEYLDTTIQPGNTYSYRIKRERYTNTSDWSNISSIEVGTGVEEKEGSASLSGSGFVISLGEKQSKTFVVISTGEKVFAQGVALETTDGPVSISGAGLTVAQGNKQVLDVISVSTSGNIVIQGVMAESNQGSIFLSAKGATAALGAKQTRAPPAIFGKGSVFASGVKSSHRNIFVVNTGQITHLGYKHVSSHISITSKTLIGTLGTKKSTGITAVFGSGRISIDGLAVETFFGEAVVFGRGNTSAIGQKSALATPIPKLRGSTFGNGSKSTGGTATTLALGRIRTKAFCMRFGESVASGVGWTTGWGKKGLVGTVRLFSHGVIAIEDIAAQNIYRFETSEADFNKGVLDGVRVEPDGSVRLVV